MNPLILIKLLSGYLIDDLNSKCEQLKQDVAERDSLLIVSNREKRGAQGAMTVAYDPTLNGLSGRRRFTSQRKSLLNPGWTVLEVVPKGSTCTMLWHTCQILSAPTAISHPQVPQAACHSRNQLQTNSARTHTACPGGLSRVRGPRVRCSRSGVRA